MAKTTVMVLDGNGSPHAHRTLFVRVGGQGGRTFALQLDAQGTAEIETPDGERGPVEVALDGRVPVKIPRADYSLN